MERAPRIAVYGSSTVADGDPGYRLAQELGAALAHQGATVMTGGYGGVMEAASRGAAEAGGHVVGVTIGLFDARGAANPWVKERVHAADLFERLRHLVTTADAHVAVEASLGTLTELFLTWTLLSAGALRGRLVLLGTGWPEWLAAQRDVVGAEHFRHVQLARTAHQAAQLALAAAVERTTREPAR